MSISSAIAAAASGLQVSARQTELIATNVANATTESYARRELAVASLVIGSTGQGVAARGVVRMTTPWLTGERRLGEAETAGRDTQATFLARVEAALGAPDTDGSLTARIAGLDAALASAASRPDLTERLTAVVSAAQDLARALDSASDTVQAGRQQADAAIASDVAAVNAALAGVAEMNTRIRQITSVGGDPSALMDERQRLIDGIAEVVPLREVARGNGQVALYSAGGASLVDGAVAAKLAFTPTPYILPEMTLDSGALSGLTLDGRPVAAAEGGLLDGGRLAANFGIRDRLAPEAQGHLDGLALELAARFGPGGPDATLGAGQAGLFTDAGAAAAAAAEAGLAQRLALNPAVVADQGGAAWRLRDGLAAAAPGASGDGSLLLALRAALTARAAPASAAFGTGARDVAALAAEIVSAVAADRLATESAATYAAARTTAFETQERAQGVDSDRELQDLLLFEKVYAANAKVLQTVDDLLSLLLEI